MFLKVEVIFSRIFCAVGFRQFVFLLQEILTFYKTRQPTVYTSDYGHVLCWFCSFRLWRFINHLLTYLLTYLSSWPSCTPSMIIVRSMNSWLSCHYFVV